MGNVSFQSRAGLCPIPGDFNSISAVLELWPSTAYDDIASLKADGTLTFEKAAPRG